MYIQRSSNSAETSTPTSNDTDLQLRYYSDELDDEDNREYILPDLLTRYFEFMKITK